MPLQLERVLDPLIVTFLGASRDESRDLGVVLDEYDAQRYVFHGNIMRAVIGGLISSTMLTLVLIPTLYVMLEERFPRRVEAPEGAPPLQGDPA